MHIIQLLEIHKSILYPNAFIFNLSESHAISRGGGRGGYDYIIENHETMSTLPNRFYMLLKLFH